MRLLPPPPLPPSEISPLSLLYFYIPRRFCTGRSTSPSTLCGELYSVFLSISCLISFWPPHLFFPPLYIDIYPFITAVPYTSFRCCLSFPCTD
ncbi:uncharacterized protein LACBIDRAFT_308791 [Laccaria bicolor S238N-H82]|uniref:Predicted protein n=1 Tax=Laccaria bicolor (strain S238N-H82 / ATCC MYA-4686) TaxID=486041 RepID=B0CX76_LACBS|nr:uncharacterized protein LACBIDRAFT_308791 [Laccaria bicolor S238N-H82]EDR13205.1 predicted protein [Laccaria bicolor S238N-H82]|eukprot:XP_001875703.1 predicted protein [Laccaria bicolor S238N-H82]